MIPQITIKIFYIFLHNESNKEFSHDNSHDKSDKSLIVCINYVLLHFYLCHFERHDSIKRLHCIYDCFGMNCESYFL